MNASMLMNVLKIVIAQQDLSAKIQSDHTNVLVLKDLLRLAAPAEISMNVAMGEMNVTWHQDGRCTDVDECQDESHSCSENATCTNSGNISNYE